MVMPCTTWDGCGALVRRCTRASCAGAGSGTRRRGGGRALGRALATFVRQRAQLLFHGLAVCDSTSHGRTNGDSRWPWKEQPRPGGHAGSRVAPGRSSRCPRSRPSGRAARTHSPARLHAQLLFRGLAVSDSTSHGGTMGDSRWPWEEQRRPREGTRHVLTGI